MRWAWDLNHFIVELPRNNLTKQLVLQETYATAVGRLFTSRIQVACKAREKNSVLYGHGVGGDDAVPP